MARGRRGVRAVFVALPLFVLAQHVVTERWGEPYPALQLPAFGGSVPDANGQARVVVPRLTVAFSDGTTAALDHDVLLADVRTLRQAVLKRLFLQGRDPDGRVTTEPRGALGKRLLLGAPAGRTYDGASRPVTDDPAFRSWLRARLREIYPGREATSLTVRWSVERYALPGGVRSVENPSLVVVTVALP